MYYPYGYRPQYYPQPPRVQPTVPTAYLPYRQPYYPPTPQYYAPSLYASYTGFQPPRPQVPQVPPMASQSLASPTRNFQSPVRGLASPPRNNLMHSQQQPQQQPQQPPQTQPQKQVLQSPTRQGYLTYDQVMERIKNANNQQPQQPPQQQHSQQKPQPPQPQQKKPQPNPQQQQPKVQPQGILESTPVPNKEFEIKKPKQQEEPEHDDDGRQQDENEDQDGQDGQLEELALQYEDGYIYRGQGYLPQTRSGFGMLTDAEGKEVYVGYWHDNFYQGQGRLTNLQVEAIDGPFDWNNMTNIGNGWESYEGQFEGGKMHGKGTLVLSNQEKFSGEFDDGMIHGEGEYTTLDGQVIQGKWDQGYLIQVSEE